MISSGIRCRRSSSASSRPWRWASASSATHSVAVRKATRWPARQARIPSAMLRMRLAGAGRPEEDDVLAAGEEVELAEVQHRVAPQGGLEGEVELLDGLARGEPRGLDAGLA